LFEYTEIQLLAFEDMSLRDMMLRCADADYVYRIRNSVAVVVALMTGLRPRFLFSLLSEDVRIVRNEPLVISAFEDKRFDSVNEALANDYMFLPSNDLDSVNKRFKLMLEIYIKLREAADLMFLQQNNLFGGLVGEVGFRSQQPNEYFFFPLCCEDELGVAAENRAQLVGKWLKSVLEQAISRERYTYVTPNGEVDTRSRISAYSLRKTTASLLFSAGLPVFRIEQWMHWSHSTRTSVSSYIHKNFGSPLHSHYAKCVFGDIVRSYSEEGVVESRHERHARQERRRRWQIFARN